MELVNLNTVSSLKELNGTVHGCVIRFFVGAITCLFVHRFQGDKFRRYGTKNVYIIGVGILRGSR